MSFFKIFPNFAVCSISVLKFILVLECMQLTCSTLRIGSFVVGIGTASKDEIIWDKKVFAVTISLLAFVQAAIIYVLRQTIKLTSRYYLRVYLYLASVPFFPSLFVLLATELVSMAQLENKDQKLYFILFGCFIYFLNSLKIWSAFKCYKILCAPILEKLHQHNVDLEKMQDTNSKTGKTSPEIFKDYIISPWNVAIHTVIGSGNFGIVYRGTYIKEKEKISIALKMIKEAENSFTFNMLLQEMKTMIHAGSHNHILKFYGVTTRGNVSGSILLVTEFCEKGCLFDYLRNLKEQITLDMTEEYENTTTKKLKYSEMLRISFEIADGMEHLVFRKIIHGDLAARNILLTKDLRVKISDFGLSHKLYNYQMYFTLEKTTACIPWRWASIETIEDLKFSHESDIWSYGVVLWEIFTLGKIPFEGIQWSSNFPQLLRNGLRLSNEGIRSEMYDIMKSCWVCNPQERLDFTRIKTMLNYNKIL